MVNEHAAISPQLVPLRALRVCFLALSCLPLALQAQKPAAPSGKTAAPPVKLRTASPATASKPSQPKLVALPIEKCFECTSSIRRRVAVMPVKTGTLASDLNRTPESVSSSVRDSIEKEIAAYKAFIVVNRGDLGDIIAEQRLGTSGAFQKDLAAPTGKLIPAELLLATTVEALNFSTRRQKQENSTAKSYYVRALQLERNASELTAKARAKGREADSLAARAPDVSVAEVIGEGLAGLSDCSGYSGTPMYQICMNQKSQAETSRRFAKEQSARKHQQKVEQARSEAARLESQATAAMEEASHLRREAELEAEKNVREVVTTTGELRIVWRALDVATGAVIASGTASESDYSEEVGEATESAFSGSQSISSSRSDVLVNHLVGLTVSKVAQGISQNLDKIPFRAKIVTTSPLGVTINAGESRGVGVGDTFGVRQEGEVLTDPDTGELLRAPGPPVGLIRVSEVQKTTAFAQVIEAGGTLRRGDELEWLGVFRLEVPGERSQPASLSTNPSSGPSTAPRSTTPVGSGSGPQGAASGAVVSSPERGEVRPPAGARPASTSTNELPTGPKRTSHNVAGLIEGREGYSLVGFWKWDCSKDWGVAVESAGSGLYSLSFCGPGGCFEPGKWRPNSKIVDDADYVVNVDGSLELRGRDGWSRLRRCPPSTLSR